MKQLSQRYSVLKSPIKSKTIKKGEWKKGGIERGHFEKHLLLLAYLKSTIRKKSPIIFVIWNILLVNSLNKKPLRRRPLKEFSLL